MEIFVNDNKIDFSPIFPLTWGHFFQTLLKNKDYIKENHGIVRIVADEKESLHVMVEETDKMVPEDINILKIYTKDSLAITRDGFNKVLNLIESIKKEISNAADLYREGKVKDASSKIVRVMEAFKPMVNFIQSVGITFSLNFNEIQFKKDITLKEKIESFLETFKDLVAAQQKKDYVEIADYLEYQLLEDMNDWSRVVNLLLQEIEAGSKKM